MSDETEVSLRAVRQALRERFGAGKYRITKSEEVHYYSKGWKFFGYLSEIKQAIKGDTMKCMYAIWEN